MNWGLDKRDKQEVLEDDLYVVIGIPAYTSMYRYRATMYGQNGSIKSEGADTKWGARLVGRRMLRVARKRRRSIENPYREVIRS